MVRHITLSKKKKQCAFCENCDYAKLRQQRGGYCKAGGYDDRKGHCDKFRKSAGQ